VHGLRTYFWFGVVDFVKKVRQVEGRRVLPPTQASVDFETRKMLAVL
jgi:hypothetical protein